MGEQARGKRILIVDDEKDVLESMRGILTRAGYQVDGVCEGCEALHIVRQKTFDLIFLDLYLPEVSGLEIFKKLKEDNWGGKVCLMTGWPKGVEAHQEDYLALVKCGVIDKMLRKPFNKDEVVRAAREIFGEGPAR